MGEVRSEKLEGRSQKSEDKGRSWEERGLEEWAVRGQGRKQEVKGRDFG